MNILIVSATWMEVKLLADELEFVSDKTDILKTYKLAGHEIDILVSGIGTTLTTFHLTNTLLNENYELVICAGIAGSLNPDLKIGEVVNVVSEEFADLGIEQKEGFLTLFESGFMKENEFPFRQGLLKANNSNGLIHLKKVRGVTVNKSHGKTSSVNELKGKFLANVESMEGAAVLYVCNWIGIPCYQIRAVSNIVEPRDILHWDIPLALENLKNSLLQVLKRIEVPVN